jgi:hypothetical protein
MKKLEKKPVMMIRTARLMMKGDAFYQDEIEN